MGKGKILIYDPIGTINQLNQDFTYERDDTHSLVSSMYGTLRATRSLSVTAEDYALTLLYRLAGSRRKAIWWIISGRAKVYFYERKNDGSGHAGLWVDHKDNGYLSGVSLGQYADNIGGRWGEASRIERWFHNKGPFSAASIIIKLLFGAVVREVKK